MIPTSHTGGLFRPADLPASGLSKLLGRSGSTDELDPALLDARLADAVEELVRMQSDVGLSIIGDGELGKGDHLTYVTGRLSGLALARGRHEWIRFLDWQRFADYYDKHPLFGESPLNVGDRRPSFVGPVNYVGQLELQRDLENLTVALGKVGVRQAFYPATAPGIVLDYFPNRYYSSDEECLFAIADALAMEYESVVKAGFLLQIDAPDLAQNFCFLNFTSVESYLAATELRIEALNHALRNIPKERIRLHVCWGSWWGPHQTDVPLRAIVKLLLTVKMGCLSIEAATVNHAADWHVWEETRIPEDLVLMPGVITHKTDTVEDPRLVADQLLQYARIVGRERVVAGTDCGMVRCPAESIAWAKFGALVEGARLASRELWR